MDLRLDELGSGPDETVVVLGCGPVGAVAALALARQGVEVLVLEAAPEPSDDPHESRASTFHPPTLEMLDELGVYAELAATGLVAARYQHRDRQDGVVADLDLGVLGADTPYPFRIQSEQSNLVRIVRERLGELDNVRLVDDAQVYRVRNTEGAVELSVRSSRTGHDTQIRAGWVIAADGSNSIARRELGIEFEGMTYPERYLVASTTVELQDLIPDIAYVNYVSDPDEWLVLLRTPRHWRVLFPVPPAGAEDDSAALLDPAGIEARLQSVVAYPPGYDLSHATLYNVHQRVASTFRSGRVLLVGDAAHINNPLGGMGMNSGIHDAVAAAAALRAALDGDESELDGYAERRRRIAREYVQQATHRNWKTMQETDPRIRAQHQDELRRTAADPVLAREYLLNSSMLTSARSA